jgi:hypothetical protein
LLLLDAEEALAAFRYREAVLQAWSAIETSLDHFSAENSLSPCPI